MTSELLSALDDEYDFTGWKLSESLTFSWLTPREVGHSDACLVVTTIGPTLSSFAIIFTRD